MRLPEAHLCSILVKNVEPESVRKQINAKCDFFWGGGRLFTEGLICVKDKYELDRPMDFKKVIQDILWIIGEI